MWPHSYVIRLGILPISNAMQYSNTALENTSLVMSESKSFSYGLILFLNGAVFYFSSISRTWLISRMVVLVGVVFFYRGGACLHY